jgi:hypothetical protein
MDQRMDALRRANQVRALRAQLKRDLKARQRVDRCAAARPAALSGDREGLRHAAGPPQAWPRDVKATKILHSCRVSASTTFGGLSERQRTELAGHFDR